MNIARRALAQLIETESKKQFDDIDNIVKEAEARVLSKSAGSPAPVVSKGLLESLGNYGRKAGILTAVGVGSWGAIEGINAIRDKMAKNRRDNQIGAAYEQMMERNPDLAASVSNPEELKEIYGVYGALAPTLAQHPLLMASLFRQTGVGNETALNPQIIKSMTSIEKDVTPQKQMPGLLAQSIIPKAPTYRGDLKDI